MSDVVRLVCVKSKILDEVGTVLDVDKETWENSNDFLKGYGNGYKLRYQILSDLIPFWSDSVVTCTEYNGNYHLVPSKTYKTQSHVLVRGYKGSHGNWVSSCKDRHKLVKSGVTLPKSLPEEPTEPTVENVKDAVKTIFQWNEKNPYSKVGVNRSSMFCIWGHESLASSNDSNLHFFLENFGKTAEEITESQVKKEAKEKLEDSIKKMEEALDQAKTELENL